jgi:hypothetical protein
MNACTSIYLPGEDLSMAPSVVFTERSRNPKTGPMPVSTIDQHSCPPVCPLKGAGCYAENGNVALIWSGMTKAGPNSTFPNGSRTVRTMDWDGYCASVAKLDPGTPWRHAQAGDLPHQGGELDRDMVEALATANKGRRGFGYTHAEVIESAHNRSVVAGAVAAGFALNLSGNTVAHADELADLDVAPVVAVLPLAYERKSSKGEWTESYEDYVERMKTLPDRTPAGRKIVVCPATYRNDTSCTTCLLCQKTSRRSVVGFPAHGSRKKVVDLMAA